MLPPSFGPYKRAVEGARQSTEYCNTREMSVCFEQRETVAAARCGWLVVGLGCIRRARFTCSKHCNCLSLLLPPFSIIWRCKSSKKRKGNDSKIFDVANTTKCRLPSLPLSSGGSATKCEQGSLRHLRDATGLHRCVQERLGGGQAVSWRRWPRHRASICPHGICFSPRTGHL